jgi:Holliday junction resolvase
MRLKQPRQKGNALEYHVRDLLKGYGFDARRSPMSGAIKGFGLEPDIISRRFPFFIECKADKSQKFWRWWKKANDESGPKPPLIVWKKDRDDIYCFLLFSDLMRLITDKTIIKEKIKKPQKQQKLSLQETSKLRFSKLHQVRKKNKT